MAADYSTFAGETLVFSFSLPDHPAGDGWAAVAHLRCGSEKQSVTLSPSGDLHVATVAAATTAEWKPGLYDLHVIATKDGEKAVASSKTLAVQPDPSADTLARTALETELAAVDAAITAVLAGEGVQSYTVQTLAGSRQIQRMTLSDLRDHRRYLEGKIDSERKEMGLRPKNQRWKRIGVEFV